MLKLFRNLPRRQAGIRKKLIKEDKTQELKTIKNH